MRKKLDLIGQKFNRLVVIDYSGIRNGKTYWGVKCDCGEISFFSYYMEKYEKPLFEFS